MLPARRPSFPKQTRLAAGGLAFGMPALVRGQNLNSRIQVGCIGAGGKGDVDVTSIANCGAEIAALCDVDARLLDKKAAEFPEAKKFVDFRKMLEAMGDSLDAISISAPDHVHGVAALAAMERGKHVFCQKPLTQTVWEAREMVRIAKDKKLATQMGNQGSSYDGLRRAVEVIQAGVIGDPVELHVWTDRPVWPQAMPMPQGSDPVPDHLNWDLWLGPAPVRPFKKDLYHQINWRGWWDFGTGALGDMACHTVNMPFRALKLGYPTMVECEAASRLYPGSFPLTSRTRFEFPAREGLPPLKFWWYDGAPSGSIRPLRPYPDVVADVIKMRNSFPGSGCLIIGEKGQVFSPDDYGAVFLVKLTDEDKFTNGDRHPACAAVPQSIRRSPGHYQEWIDMIKGGPAAYSAFDIAGYLTEIILLGCVAMQAGEGVAMEWDGPAMRSPSHPELASVVKRENRKGW